MSRTRAGAAAILLLAGCGYRLAGVGGGLPGHVEILGVPPFTNESAFPEIEDGMTDALIELFQRRGGFDVQDFEEGAQAVLRATINSVDFSPAQLDSASGVASTYLVVVRAEVVLEDVVNDVELFSAEEFTLRDEFAIGDDPDAAFDREGLAFRRISQAFADSLVVAILEGF